VKAKLFVNYKKNVNSIRRDKEDTGNGEKALKIPKYNVGGLKESVVFLYKLRLAEKMKSKKIGTVDKRYSWLKDSLHQAAKEASGEKTRKCSKNKQPYWWPDTVQKAVKEKRAAYNKWLCNWRY
jgi:hypothetical protein